MSSVIAVAGGSNGLGRAIVEAIKAEGRHEVVIIGRSANPTVEKATGARVLAADYSNIDGVAALLEENKISTIISTLNAGPDPTPERNLIQAADKSKATRRFIPNFWSGAIFKDEHRNLPTFPIAGQRLETTDILRKTGLEWTVVYNGIFLEYFVDGLPTYLTRYTLGIDLDHNAAGIPGTGNTPLVFTWTFDVAKFVARLVGLQKWEEKYLVKGGVHTWNEALAICEKAKGVKFDVHYDPVEKLKKGQVTELPGHEIMVQAWGGGEETKGFVQATMAQYGLWMDEGVTDYKPKDGTFLNDVFPDVKTVNLQEAWEKAASLK